MGRSPFIFVHSKGPQGPVKQMGKVFSHRFSFHVGPTSKSTFQWDTSFSQPLTLCTLYAIILLQNLYVVVGVGGGCSCGGGVSQLFVLCSLYQPATDLLHFVCCFYVDKPLRRFVSNSWSVDPDKT